MSKSTTEFLIYHGAAVINLVDLNTQFVCHSQNRKILKRLPDRPNERDIQKLLLEREKVCLAAFSAGNAIGWCPPTVTILTSHTSPVGAMSSNETSWLIILMKLSSLLSVLISGVCMDRFGRKAGGWFLNVMPPIGWIIILTAQGKNSLYVGVVFVGTMTVATVVVGVVYLSEIVNDRIRGAIISLMVFSHSCGTLTAHLLGEYVTFMTFNGICFVMSLSFPLALFRLPESPTYLSLKGRTEDAAMAVQWFNGPNNDDVEREMKKLENVKKMNLNFRKVFLSKEYRRPLIILLFLNVFSELTGCTVIETYVGSTFEKDYGHSVALLSSTILAFLRFFTGLLSCYFIEKSGRKPVLTTSFALMGISLFSFYVMRHYFFVKDFFYYGPFVSLAVYTMAEQICDEAIEVIAGDIVAPDMKGALLSTGNSLRIVTAIFNLCIYPYLENISPQSSYMQECFFCLVGLAISIKIVPETKGKTLAEINAELTRLHK